MKKNLILLLLIIHANLISAQSILRNEILGRPTENSVLVHMIFADSVEIKAEYGTTSGTYTQQTAWQVYAPSTPVEIILNGLNSNTKYYYRIKYRQPGTTNNNLGTEHSFYTQRATGNQYTFVVQADPHLDVQSDTAIYRLCLQNQADDNPDFMIDLGDFLMSDKLRDSLNQVPHDTIIYRCNLLSSYYEYNCHSVPLYIVMGNHEGESGWILDGTANNPAVWDAQERIKYFPNPLPDAFYSGDTSNQNFIGKRQSYYSWQWGDAQFIVIDPYWYTNPKPDSLHGWRWTLGIDQYNWLKNTLQSSTAKFKFLFSHQIVGGTAEGRGGVEVADLYEWGGHNLDTTYGFTTNRPGWYKPIKDLLEENHVNIFFHGHDHFFGKQIKDCLVYQETPQPSHPNFQNANYATAYGYLQGQIIPNSGHIRVTVDSSGTLVEYVRTYLPQNENATHHNKDVSASYFIGSTNCYDSLSTGIPMLWNSNYASEIVYPNPFNIQTTVHFNCTKNENVSIYISDMNGKRIRTLINQQVKEGDYDVIWDGKNGAGNDMPSGTYVYTISKSASNSSSGKMMLVR